MKAPEDHRKLLQKKDYTLRCSAKVFTSDEYDVLKEYGHWLEGLETGAIGPITPAQRLFVIVAQGREPPSEPMERLWIKYKNRVAWEKDNGHVPTYEWKDPGESWFSRKDIDHMSPYRTAR